MDKTRPNLAGAPVDGPSHPARELRSLGGYRLLRRLGEGGMGSVYLAFKEGDGEPVALKVLSDHLVTTPGFVDRFYREARNGACLDHPNIVHSYLAAQDPVTSKHFLVLEYVEGESAQTLLDQRGRLSVGDAVQIVLGIARALEHAHSRHIIHRDIKPDNILLTRAGLPKLADLGLAKKLDEASHLTATRQGFGTTPYMPYEQAINARYADERSDIYALGATFYHLVVGIVPFQGANDLEVIEKKKQGDYLPARAHQPTLPENLDRILARMLARDPEDRYPNAAELIRDLETSGLVPEQPALAGEAPAPSDPQVQTSIASTTAPTRVNLELSNLPANAAASPVGTWFVRYRNRDGRLCNGRATTGQIIERVQAGQLPIGVEARRHSKDLFQPLTVFPEFRALMTAHKIAPSGQSSCDCGSPSSWLFLVAVSSMLLGLLAGLAALGCLPR
jgi:serine/threonine-protein kinase